MRCHDYSDPSVLDCVRRLKDLGCTRLVVPAAVPTGAYSTTGSVSDVEHAPEARWDVCDFWTTTGDPTYIRAIAASIEHAAGVDSDDKVLFSFHAPSRSWAGDTYN